MPVVPFALFAIYFLMITVGVRVMKSNQKPMGWKLASAAFFWDVFGVTFFLLSKIPEFTAMVCSVIRETQQLAFDSYERITGERFRPKYFLAGLAWNVYAMTYVWISKVAGVIDTFCSPFQRTQRAFLQLYQDITGAPFNLQIAISLFLWEVFWLTFAFLAKMPEVMEHTSITMRAIGQSFFQLCQHIVADPFNSKEVSARCLWELFWLGFFYLSKVNEFIDNVFAVWRASINTFLELHHRMTGEPFNLKMAVALSVWEIYWVAYYTMTKVPEFTENIFILIGATKRLFLHWYHHIRGEPFELRFALAASLWEVFWVTFYLMSKVPDITGAAFVVFKKMQCILVHSYHHLTLLMFFYHCGMERRDQPNFVDHYTIFPTQDNYSTINISRGMSYTAAY